MAPFKNKRQNKKKGKAPAVPGKASVNTLQMPSFDMNSALHSMVNNQLINMLGGNNPGTSHGKRLLSQRNDDDSEDMDETPPPKQARQMPQSSTTTKDYATQVVILENVKDDIKRHPSRLSEAFSNTKPNVALRSDGLRLTASGDILVKPKNPKDCNALLKENAFPANCALGENVKARVPKAQQITHQVIIRNVDIEVTQEEMDEILNRQNLPYKSAKRIHSRQRNEPTTLIRLILKDEETKKRLLRDGINLDQMHYKCIPANEDTKSFPKVVQCFKCQEIGDHHASSCPNQQKCVLCSGPHRKAECTATKETYKCANCSGNHAAWSQECPNLQDAQKMKKTPTMAQIASATVTPAMLQQAIEEIKLSMVLLVSEVVSRCLCELTYNMTDKSVSKTSLPLKVGKIATNTVSAANKLKFGPATTPIDLQMVKDTIVGMCFPSKPPASTPTSGSTSEAPSSSQRNAASKQQ